QTRSPEPKYQAYLASHLLTPDDPGVAAGAQAAAAIIQGRVGDGYNPVPPPAFFGRTGVGQWRPTVLNAAGQPAPMAASYLATTKTFVVETPWQFFSGTPPQVTSRPDPEESN